jgi:hypothetical protein
MLMLMVMVAAVGRGGGLTKREKAVGHDFACDRLG